MKRMRVSLLVLAFSVCTYAGDMPNMATGTPPPPPAAASIAAAPAYPVTEVALRLLQSVLLLF